ncbi:hypothetical protein LAZ67_23000842 [Cordylochernes scorpioides]|uniref:Retrovirus-related Pol polyprotein from transposon TNT 1-94 n=1 Tax=Cordylochernes scorpioides TaxID=51811 RepID=A0ABY6LSS6_9ARAC|nr:hypothetical protein LAZ67_23000842 [Cordylochernes scorpioides]
MEECYVVQKTISEHLQAPGPRSEVLPEHLQAPGPHSEVLAEQASAPGICPSRSYTPNPEPKPVYPRKTYNKSPDSNWNRTEDGRPICFKCNKPGHVARYCRVRFVRIVEEDPIVTQDKIKEEIRMDNGTEKSRPLLYADRKIKSAKDAIIPKLSIELIKAFVEAEDGEYIVEENHKMFQTNGLRLSRSEQKEHEEPQFQINENLSYKEKEQLKQVLEKYADLFSSGLGRSNLAKHRIDTEGAKPNKYKPYRVSAKEREIRKEQIDEMLRDGIIRPSSSPWSFSVILVKKRDGKYRFCVDYRKLNDVTVKDVYPIPRIDEVLDTLQGSKYLSAIDLKSGYWQVEVEEKDKEKTAFTTAHGLYEFNEDNHLLTLKEVLYVPELKNNLISVSKITEDKKQIIFDENGARIIDNKGSSIITAKREDNIYTIDACANIKLEENVFKTQENNWKIWHKRLAHINENYMNMMLKDSMVYGFSCSPINNLEPCITCIQSKFTRLPFKEIDSKQSTKPLDLIHMDLIGPFQHESIGRAIYVLNIVDDFSRKIFPKFLKSKSETFAKLKEFIEIIENIKGTKIKRIRSDNGGDFTNRQLSSYLIEKGIEYQFRTFYSLSQNGIVERANRSLIEDKNVYNLRPTPEQGFYYESSLSDEDTSQDDTTSDSTYHPADSVMKVDSLPIIPTNYEEAINSPDKEKWVQAMKGEIDSLKNHKVWDVLPMTKTIKPIKSKWVFSIKNSHDPLNPTYKARLVAVGCTQKLGVDYSETYSPVIKSDSLRTLIAFAAMKNLHIHHFDIETAFLYGKLEETIYMSQPKGFEYQEEGVVDGTYRKPIKQETNEEKEAYVKWESEVAISQLLFTTSVMPDVSQLIIPCSSAKDMWDKLLSVYEQSSGQRLDMLYNQFFNFKKDPTDDISKHISKLESLWNDKQNELTKQENLLLPESMLMCRIINTLPDEYFDFKSVWESVSKEERSVDNLTQRLRLREIRIQQRDECSTSSSTALMANAYENKQNMKGKVTKSNENLQKTRETRECYFCHRKGHLAKDCRYAKQKKLKDKEKDETKLKLNSKLSESLISERFNEQDEDIWIGDSGATNHITRNASFYTSYKNIPTQQTVKVGSNEKLIAYGSGTITIETCVKDGGKEFVNKETSKITNKYGINHRITMPYTPQQNGSAERENRTLIEAARLRIYAKNMSLKLWAEAVNTATYVLNRTGPAQIEKKTPYELWFNKKTADDHLRIFRTECFVHVPDEKRRKLDAKSEKGILVGYCSNKDGYRIWIPNSNKVVTSRDVIFKETIPTFSLDIEKRNKELSSSQIDEQNNTQDIEKIESNVQTSDVYNLRDRSNTSKPQRYIDAEINIAEGFVQNKGIDYEETFSPLARHDTLRTLLAIAANEDLKLVQFDIKTAFLYGDLQDQIYIKQPEGFNNGTDLVWKLKKYLYGLKQSPTCWNQKIVNFMKERCLKESTADPCLFFRKTNDQLLIIAIYVDDGIIAGTNEQEIKEFLDELMFSFKITSEPLNYFLDIEIERQPDGSIFINQKAYIKIILEKFNMSQANKVGTPTDNSTVPRGAEILENVPFREAIG